MIVHRAAWVLPIAAPPIRHGWVAVDRGRIVATGGPRDRPPNGGEEFTSTGSPSAEVILPGLVNAHVHLELSWMHGAVPRSTSMPAWASLLIKLRRARVEEPPVTMGTLFDARGFGTVLVGDVTNTLATYRALASGPVHAALFFEQLGFHIDNPAAHARAAQAQIDALPPTRRVRVHVAAHAPYSVSPRLLTAIAGLNGVVSIHLAESPEELQFLKDGTGPWRALLEELGVWTDAWRPPGCGPVEYIARAGLLTNRLLAVHGVQLTAPELARLAAAGATLVCCPRSNQWTGAGTPPVARFYASGVRVAVGTDSLASVEDLNVFAELAAMRRLAPSVPASRLLDSATRIGANALGFGGEFGTIEPGKRAELIAVRLRDGVEDVEEYLVGGVQAKDIRWLEPVNG